MGLKTPGPKALYTCELRGRYHRRIQAGLNKGAWTSWTSWTTKPTPKSLYLLGF